MAVALRVAVPVFLGAVLADLLSKRWAVAHASNLIFNHRASDLPLRLGMSLVAVGAAVLLSRLALVRGLGRQWGLWVGCALLVAGILANGVSPYLWSSGVPDFIEMRDGWVWNVADFEIAFGLSGGLLSVAASALITYTRHARLRSV